jgi:cell division protein FtsQ
MELPRSHKYSFPVILGMYPGEPLSTRVPRMKAYNELVRELDSSGAHYSQDLSEVDLSDLDDLKVRVNDPAGDVLVELGSSDYLKRYKTYVGHVQEWRQQFQKLESVNLRYDNQVIVNPDMEGKPKPPALSATAAKAAVAAGVKPAALVTRLNPHDPSVPKPAFELSQPKLDPKAAAARKTAATAKATKSPAKPATGSARVAPASGRPSRVRSAHGSRRDGGATKAAATHKPGPVKPGSAKTGSGKTGAVNPDAKRSVQPVAPVAGTPKPSPAIVKPSGSGGPG